VAVPARARVPAFTVAADPRPKRAAGLHTAGWTALKEILAMARQFDRPAAGKEKKECAALIELNLAKDGAKKAKWGSKWVVLYSGPKPRLEWYKNEKACKPGKEEATLSLLDAMKRPGSMAEIGEHEVTLPKIAEASRDFMRAFSACAHGSGDLLIMGLSELKEPGAGPSPMVANVKSGGDVNAENAGKAVEEFTNAIIAPALEAAGVLLPAEELGALCGTLVANLTVSPATDVLLGNGASASMYQNKYIVAIGPGQVRVGLYPIVTLQHRSTTLYQVSYQIQYLFFESDNRILP
jgi:hypothetical protein